MNTLDISVIVFYFIIVFYLAYQANRFVKNIKDKGLSHEIELQYLAGKTVTYWECLFSTCAASVSAFHFLVLPGIVFATNMSYIQFVLGALVSRFIVSVYLLPKIYGKGLTVIQAIAEGNSYKNAKKVSYFGRKFLALLYFIFKIIDVGLKLYLGSMLVSGFFGLSVILSMIGLCLVTYTYTIIGGLKAVVRTDIMQFFLLLIAGLTVPFVMANLSGHSIVELGKFAYAHGKFSFLETSGIGGFITGLIAGILYDLTATSCDQEIVQKLIATRKLSLAKKALRVSSWITILVNFLFLSIGAILWSFAQKKGITLEDGAGAFYQFILVYIPSPLKGLIVAGAMAAIMSSLDSAINALSAVYWNDIMPSQSAKNLQLYIKLDMLIIAQVILFCGCVISKFPNIGLATESISHWASAPLLALIIGRIAIVKFFKLEFNLFVVITSYAASFFGLVIGKVYFKSNIDLAVIMSVLCSFMALIIYSKFTLKLDFKAREY